MKVLKLKSGGSFTIANSHIPTVKAPAAFDAGRTAKVSKKEKSRFHGKDGHPVIDLHSWLQGLDNNGHEGLRVLGIRRNKGKSEVFSAVFKFNDKPQFVVGLGNAYTIGGKVVRVALKREDWNNTTPSAQKKSNIPVLVVC